jgi:hypothetical protein
MTGQSARQCVVTTSVEHGACKPGVVARNSRPAALMELLTSTCRGSSAVRNSAGTGTTTIDKLHAGDDVKDLPTAPASTSTGPYLTRRGYCPGRATPPSSGRSARVPPSRVRRGTHHDDRVCRQSADKP